MGDSRNYFHIPCPVCSSRRFKIKYPDSLGVEMPCLDYDFRPAHSLTYRIVKCLDCGHGYSSPHPAMLWKNYESVADVVYLKSQDQRLLTARKVIKEILRHCSTGRLLDVGCATGDFLTIAQEHFRVEGVELSKWSTDIARSRGLVIHNCELANLETSEPYDVVTLWGVIEHFEDPVIEIKNIARLMRSGGIVCLWTGDFESCLSKLFGKKWWWVQGQHINLFSKRSLCRLFENNDFDLVRIGLYPYVTTMQSMSRSLGRYPLLTKITKYFLNGKLLSNVKITLRLPGEMFAIFRKR
jgi:SAM-dependent methyltransferase